MKKIFIICFSLFVSINVQAFDIKNMTTGGLLDSSFESDEFSTNDVVPIVHDNGDVTFLSKAFDSFPVVDMEGFKVSTDSTPISLSQLTNPPPFDSGKNYREMVSYDAMLISVHDDHANFPLPGSLGQSLFLGQEKLSLPNFDKINDIRLIGAGPVATLTFVDQNQKLNLVSFIKTADDWSMVADSHTIFTMSPVTSAVSTADAAFTFYVLNNSLRVYRKETDSFVSLVSANTVYLSSDNRSLFWMYGDELSMVRVAEVTDWASFNTPFTADQTMSVANDVVTGRQMKPTFSSTGQFVAFLRSKTIDEAIVNQVYFKNLATFEETQISLINSFDFLYNSYNPSMSPNGKYVAFSANETQLPPLGPGARSGVHHLWRVKMDDQALSGASSIMVFPKASENEGSITLVPAGLKFSNNGEILLALTHFISNGNDASRRIYLINSRYYGRWEIGENDEYLIDSPFDSIQLSQNGKVALKTQAGLLFYSLINNGELGAFNSVISEPVSAYTMNGEGTLVAFQDNSDRIKLYRHSDSSIVNLGDGTNPILSASGERLYYLDGTALKVKELIAGSWVTKSDFEQSDVSAGFSVSYNGRFVVYEKLSDWYRYDLFSGIETPLDESEVALSSGAGWSVGKSTSEFYVVNHVTGGSTAIPNSAGLQDVLISSDGSQIAKISSTGDLTIESYSVPDSGSYSLAAPEVLLAHHDSPLAFYFNVMGGRDSDLSLIGSPSVSVGTIEQVSPMRFKYTPIDGNLTPVSISFTLQDRNLVEHQLSLDVLPDLYINGQGETAIDGIDFVLSINPDGSVLFESNYDVTAMVGSSFSTLVINTDGSISFTQNPNLDTLGYEDVLLTFDSGNGSSERKVRLEYGRDLALLPGWNLVGIPYTLSDKSLADLKASSFSTWAWDGSHYQSSDVFERGEAYWVFALPEQGTSSISVVLAPTVIAPAKNSELSDEEKAVTLDSEWNLFSPVGYGKLITSQGYVWRWNNGQQIYEPIADVDVPSLEGLWQKASYGWVPDGEGKIFPVLNQN